MVKVLIGVDIQNDFVTGALGSKEAENALPKIQKLYNSYVEDGNLIVLTKDIHGSEYLSTQEGRNLPILHTQRGTKGAEIAIKVKAQPTMYIEKSSFGTHRLTDFIKFITEEKIEIEHVMIVGFCTDICVITAALMLKAAFPELTISVDASCCAGTTAEKHNAALDVMESCQIKVVNR